MNLTFQTRILNPNQNLVCSLFDKDHEKQNLESSLFLAFESRSLDQNPLEAITCEENFAKNKMILFRRAITVSMI